MIPVSRPYPPPRDDLWLNPQFPQVLPLASDQDLCSTAIRLPTGRPTRPAWRTLVRESGAFEGRPESLTTALLRSLDMSRPPGTTAPSLEIACPCLEAPATPSGTRRFNA